MQIIDLSNENSIIGQYMAEMRDKNYQQNRLLFRNNITRVGEMMAYVRETRLQVDHSAVPLELQIDFVVSAVLGVISRWLDQGLVYTSRYMTLNVAKMLNGAEGLTAPVTTFFDAQLQVELGIQPA